METSLLQADEAANMIDIDGKVISRTLNLHKTELKSALKITKNRTKRVKHSQILEKWSLTIYIFCENSITNVAA